MLLNLYCLGRWKCALDVVHLNNTVFEHLLLGGNTWKKRAHSLSYLADLNLLDLLLKMVDPWGMELGRRNLMLLVAGSHITAEKELSFGWEVLSFDHLSWLVVGARKEDWVLKAEWTLLGDESIEVLVAQVPFLVFIFLESFDAVLLDRWNLVIWAWGFKTFDRLGGVAGDLKAVTEGFIFSILGRDVEVS